MTNSATPTFGVRNPVVLEPEFVDGLESLTVDEVRTKRDQALAEREFQSYLRRLIQVRQDIFHAERDRRRSGGEPGHVVDRLRAVLAEGPRGKTRGEALRFSLSPDELEEADRRAQESLGPLASARPEDIADDELEQAFQLLEQEERAVSLSRLAVFKVHDRLQDELKRRYREDPSSVQPHL
jgi:hypothetical protein